jgi:arginine decarboxylase
MSYSDLVAELQRYREKESHSFHMPGHKAGDGAHPIARDVLGLAAFRADVSEVGGFDYLHSPTGRLRDAQEFAARLFGADRSHFLVNGSTVGNIAGILACIQPGERILVDRACHRSVYAGIILSGALPIYIAPQFNDELDGFLGTHEVLENCDHYKRQRIRAIHATTPSYYGVCSNLAPYVALGKSLEVPLLVDEAHGSHFSMHTGLPPSALSTGADLVVNSIHKTLTSLTQSSILHTLGRKVNGERLMSALQMLQSSSPSALLLLSLDIACRQMDADGRGIFDRILQLSHDARESLNAIPGVTCYGEEIATRSGIHSFDPTKLVVDVRAMGCTGLNAAEWLKDEFAIGVELADEHRLVFSITPGDSAEALEFLILSVAAASREPSLRMRIPHVGATAPKQTGIPEMILSPRDAVYANTRFVPFGAAVDETSADFVIPYPPGIPIIVPGERLHSHVLRYLRHLGSSGNRITGTSDPLLRTMRVVDSLSE